MTGPRIELSIDALVLHGLTTTDEESLRQAVERELTRMIGDAPALPPGPHVDADSLGARIAQAIHGGDAQWVN